MAALKRPVLCLMGPTAAGKTALALDLAAQGNFDFISADSAQVYRRMDVGTAKPTPAELALAPHALIDIREPWEPYSAADFAAEAGALIERSWEQGRTPVLVGGTLLYFRALMEGLSELPEADTAVRAKLAREAEAKGWAALHEQLRQVDPVSAGRIHRNDPQRIQRALEVFRLTGQTLTELTGETRAGLPARWLKLAISPADRAVLHQRIELRFAQMVEAGLLEEVEALRRDPRVHAGLPAMRAVGYRQAWQFLDGEFSREELLLRGVAATRQLAKRQLTWLRRLTEVTWLDPTESGWREDAAGHIARFLHTALC